MGRRSWADHLNTRPAGLGDNPDPAPALPAQEPPLARRALELRDRARAHADYLYARGDHNQEPLMTYSEGVMDALTYLTAGGPIPDRLQMILDHHTPAR